MGLGCNQVLEWPAVAEEPVTDTEVLLEVYSLLVTIKRVLIALLVVVALLGATGVIEAAQERSERKAERYV